MPRALPFRLASWLLSASGIFACVFLAPAALGQAAPAQSADAASQLAPGTTICAVLEKTVDAKKAKAGDAIVAKTTMAVLSHGKVAIASGARIVGHVTSVKAHSKNQAKSQLGMAFDRVVLKGGGEIPLQLTLQAIGYGGLPPAQEDETAGSYSQAAAAASQVASGGSRRSGFPPPRPEPADTPTAAAPGTAPRNPALDGGSKGVVGINGLTLTEGTDAARGSTVEATKKNVKIERGSQLILRVIADASPL